MMPSVSIIIPIYNKRDYLADCIAQLLNQTFSDYEIILIDDGSTDGSDVVADEFASRYSHIKVFHQVNQGVSVARNVGVQKACGNWIWFIDADDIPESAWLQKIQPLFQCDHYDIICSDFNKVFPDGSSEPITTGIQGAVDPAELPDLFVKKQRSTGYFGYLWCKLIRREFMQNSKASFQPGLTLAEDLKFMVALYEQNPRCCFTNDVAMNYTVNALNSSGEKAVDYQAQLEIRYEIYQWIQGTSCFDKNKQYLQAEVSRFSAFLFFHGYEEFHSVTRAREFFIKHPEYFECLSVEGVTGIMKTIVTFLRHKRYAAISLMLSTRYQIRKLFRKVAYR